MLLMSTSVHPSIKSIFEYKVYFYFVCCNILDIKWNDFISNSEVSRRSGLEDIRETVQQRCLVFFGHVVRLPTVVPASAALSIACAATDAVSPMPDWKRPPKTWLKQITADLDSIPQSAADALQLTTDRPTWRAVATATKLRAQ